MNQSMQLTIHSLHCKRLFLQNLTSAILSADLLEFEMYSRLIGIISILTF